MLVQPIARTARGSLALASLLVVLGGCGSGVDTQIRTQAERGILEDGPALTVVDSEYVCPHQVPMRNREFRTTDIKAGDVRDQFGPMVPCGTVVQAGSGLCPSCKNPYHTPGTPAIGVCTNLRFTDAPRSDGQVLEEAPVALCNEVLGPYQEGGMRCSACDDAARQWVSSATELPPAPWSKASMARPSGEALVQFRCPYDDCAKPIDPVALQRVDTDPRDVSRFQPGQCPFCQRYFEAEPSDVLETIAFPEQVICPGCTEPVDPSMNACTNPSCTLGGVVRNVDLMEGPCWRCGGVKICPECGGSGLSPQGVYGAASVATLPPGCWYCETVVDPSGASESTGRCPECDWLGFATYTGGLPPEFQPRKNMGGGSLKALPSAARNWQIRGDEPTGGAP